MIGKKINQLATELAPVSTDLTIIGDPTTGVSKKITLAQLGAIFSGAVSFYTNLAGFPAVGDINVIYCAKDTQKLYLWSGSAYVEVFPSQALLDTYQLRSEKGNANGYASLDSQGKVPISQLPSSIMEYKGTWNASTNTPTLANGTGDTGDVYICNVAGTVNFGAGAITFAVGDYVIYSGTIWQRSSGAVGTVTSVAASITGNSVTISGSPVTTSGTLAFAFAGTGAQYIKGDGTLATFPNTIDQAKNLITEVYNSTGATLTKGTVVYINGGQGNLPTVTKALASGDSTSAQTYGIVQADITNMNNGFVVVAGRLTDIDTQAYANGTQLYLSSTTAGAYTSTKQYAPAHLVYIGIIVRSHPTQGVIEVKIQNGYELDELHNVAAQTPTNNDGLFWEASTSLWKNKSIATILGYTPQAQLNGTGFVKASGTTITYDNSTYLTTSAAATTYLPLVLSSTTNVVDINGQQFNIYGSGSGFTSGRIIIDPVFSAIGYQNAGVFDGLKILTNGNAEFSNSGVTRFFNQVRFDSTLTNGTYTYTLPGATGTIALTSDLTGGTVTSVGLSSATSGVTIGSTPITTSGTITLAIATASGSQQGLLSSTDWTTFNNKQNALTNPVTGTGTTNYLPKFTGTSTIGNSAVFESGGNVGIGTATPSQLLHLETTLGSSSGVGTAIQITSGGAGGDQAWIGVNKGTGNGFEISVENRDIIFNTGAITPFGGTERMRLTASGNLGLGVTPSAWLSTAKAIQINSLVSVERNSVEAYVGHNFFYNSSNSPAYIINGHSSRMGLYQGSVFWDIAPSGTAGSAISFTQAMTLNASGNLSIGNTNDTYKLDVSGTGRFTGNGFFGGATVFAGLNGGISVNGSSSSGINFRTGDTLRGYIYTASSNMYLESVSGSVIIAPSGNPALTIASTGAATFSSSITANGNNITIQPTTTTTYALSVMQNAGGYLRVGRDTSTGALYGDAYAGLVVSSGAYPLIFGTNDTERLRITSGGNVGIGTTAPNSLFVVNGGDADFRRTSANSRILITAPGVANTVVGFNNSGSTVNGVINNAGYIGVLQDYPFIVTIADIERFRIAASTGAATFSSSVMAGGNILVPAGSGLAWSGDASRIMTPEDNVSGALIQTPGIIRFNAGGSEKVRITSGGNVGIGTTSPDRALTVNGQIGINNDFVSTKGGQVFRIGYEAYTSTGGVNLFTEGAIPLVLGTSSTERLRITSGGSLLIGKTSVDWTVTGIQTENNSKSFGITADGSENNMFLRKNNATGNVAQFWYNSTSVGTISISTTATSYNTSSDYRLKTDYKDFSGLDLVSKIKAYDYEWKSDKSRSYGVIAHELQSVINYAVTGVKDGEQMQGVDYSKIVPVLIKAIQEQQQQIEQLKNK